MQPLQGAMVMVMERRFGVLTNEAGYYSLPNVPAGEQSVVVRILGYATQERTVTVTAG